MTGPGFKAVVAPKVGSPVRKARQRSPNGTRLVVQSVRLDALLLAEARAVAEEQGATFSELLRQGLQDAISKHLKLRG